MNTGIVKTRFAGFSILSLLFSFGSMVFSLINTIGNFF